MQPPHSLGPSNSGIRSVSQTSLQMGQPMPYYQPAYPMPTPARDFYGRRRKEVQGRGRSYVMYGIAQVIIGLLCFILALIAISVSMNATFYSAGCLSGIIFILTGVFGCMVGSSLSDCYVMTYRVMNMLSVVAALACIGLSGWEVNKIGSMSSMASSDGFMAVKASVVIISCIIMLGLSARQAHKLRRIPCCSLQAKENKKEGFQRPMDCVMPVSNTTTNSSWNWNMQHNVQGRQESQYPSLTREYATQMEGYN